MIFTVQSQTISRLSSQNIDKTSQNWFYTYFRSTCTRTCLTRMTWELIHRGKSSVKMLTKCYIAAPILLTIIVFHYADFNFHLFTVFCLLSSSFWVKESLSTTMHCHRLQPFYVSQNSSRSVFLLISESIFSYLH